MRPCAFSKRVLPHPPARPSHSHPSLPHPINAGWFRVGNVLCGEGGGEGERAVL